MPSIHKDGADTRILVEKMARFFRHRASLQEEIFSSPKIRSVLLSPPALHRRDSLFEICHEKLWMFAGSVFSRVFSHSSKVKGKTW